MTQGEADGSYQDIPVVTPIRGGQLTNEELLKWLEDDDSSIAELSATSGGKERADETQEEQQALLLDCEIDPYLDDMPTSLPAKGTLATMFGAIVPDREPTISKLRTTKSRVANLLSTIKSRAAPLGLSYIVEDEAQWRLRIGSKDAELPEYPELPVLVKNPTTIQYKVYEDANAHYEAVWFWNGKVIALVNKLYPGMMIGLEIPSNPGMLPSLLEAKDALAHIRTQVCTDAAANLEYLRLTDELRQLTYVPNQNGSVEFFNRCIDIQNQVRDLGDVGSITDAHIMTIAQQAFLSSTHTKMYVAGINAQWSVKKEKSLLAFRTHYNAELKRLWDNGDRGEAQQANSAIDDRFTDMQRKMAAMSADNAKLREDMGLSATDGTATTDDASTVTMATLQRMMDNTVNKAFAEAENRRAGNANSATNRTNGNSNGATGNSTGTGNTGRTNTNSSGGRGRGGGRGGGSNGNGTRTLGWRKLDKFCDSRGPNTRCDGTMCYRYWCKKREGHDPTLTFERAVAEETEDRPVKNKERWGKWLDPNNNLCDHGPNGE